MNYLNLPTSDAGSALAEGRIDGFAISVPSSTVRELETSHKIRLVTLSPEEKAAFSAKFPQYVWLSVPAGELKSAPEGYQDFGLYNLFLSTTDVPDDWCIRSSRRPRKLRHHQLYFPAMEKGMQFENVNFNDDSLPPRSRQIS